MKLQEGTTPKQVTQWLGQAAVEDGPHIYVEKSVAQWHYPHSGVVYFENDALRYVDMPETFTFSL